MNTQIKLTSFSGKIMYFNGMYKLPVAPYPTVNAILAQNKESIYMRLCNFKKILTDEIQEMDDITERLQAREADPHGEIDTLTELADLLGDIVIYCASEMIKFGIPFDKTLDIIMQSNFSKLDAAGNPIYNEMGKVMKGPYYYKPEIALKLMLLEEIDYGKGTSPGLEK